MRQAQSNRGPWFSRKQGEQDPPSCRDLGRGTLGAPVSPGMGTIWIPIQETMYLPKNERVGRWRSHISQGLRS